MIIVSTNTEDFLFQSSDDTVRFVQTVAEEKSDIWISRNTPYPCISVCVNGKYAAIHFFQNDAGDMWLSYNDNSQEEITFIVNGEEWTPDANAIITVNDMFLCIREFLDTNKRPICIQWQEL